MSRSVVVCPLSDEGTYCERLAVVQYAYMQVQEALGLRVQ